MGVDVMGSFFLELVDAPLASSTCQSKNVRLLDGDCLLFARMPCYRGDTSDHE
jgi:hypothetical protein